MPERDNEVFYEINAKLGQTVRLLALMAIERANSLEEKAVRLSSAGLAPKEIAALIGTTPNTVSVALSAARRKSKKVKLGKKG